MPVRRKSGFGVFRNGGDLTVFSNSDIELLKLLHRCGNVQPETLTGVFDPDELQNLMAAGLVHLHKGSRSVLITEKGRRCLGSLTPDRIERVSLSYRGSLIQRRIRISKLAVTAYQACPDIFADAISELSSSPTLYLPTLSRGKESNLWGSSRMAALLRLGDLCCGVYSVFHNAGTINPEDERKTLGNCVAQFRGVNTAFMFTGETYASILTELDRKDAVSEGKLLTYGEMWRRSSLPVHLVSCDETGALQLRLMAQPDYRKRLAHAGLGEEYAPPPKELPHCDGMLKGVPFVIAVDMDLIRLEAACAEAHRAGFRQIAAAALRGQVQTVLRDHYQGRVKLFTITDKTLTAAFGSTLPPYRPRRGAYLNKIGDVVDVLPIQGHRKTGGQSGT